MHTLESILREIEIATAEASAPGGDLAAAGEAMGRRQRAVVELSKSTGALEALSPEEREEVSRRLQAVTDVGAKAEQWLLTVKSDALAEWTQWSHIYRALGAARGTKPTLIDCRG